MSYVHAYDDPDVIAGRGTIGMEILRQLSGPLDAVFVPVGGGGLLAGIAAYIKYVRPAVRVIGVEPDDAACLAAALKAGRRVKLTHVGIFADGVAVGQIGKETFRVIRQTVDEVITVSTDEMCAAIKDIFDDTRSIAEPAGALALAGLKKYIEREGVRGQTLVAIDSGANTNFDRLRHISERTEIGEKREAVLSVTIPEQPGSFRAFCNVVGRQRSITEFNYRYADAGQARIFVGVQVSPERGDRETLVEELGARGYPVMDLSDNEMAKLHVRYMVGGRAPAKGAEEIVYRFEFPERPGALLNFLNKLEHGWNISLFHYRNHGADFARVLVGFQVPKRSAGHWPSSSRKWPVFTGSTTIGTKARIPPTGYSWAESREAAHSMSSRSVAIAPSGTSQGARAMPPSSWLANATPSRRGFAADSSSLNENARS